MKFLILLTMFSFAADREKMYDIEIEGKIMKVKESVLLKLSNSVQKEIDAKKEIDYSKCDLLIKKRMDCIGEVDLKYNKEK